MLWLVAGRQIPESASTPRRHKAAKTAENGQKSSWPYAWRWQAACPCARTVRPPFSLTGAKCSRRAR
eukprot:scaffold610_cov64-Phaeocystis_antarctica.AAC.5